MVHFKDVTVSRQQFLVILNDENQSTEKGTRLVVHEPLDGKYARTMPKLTNFLYHREWSMEVSSNTAWILKSAHHEFPDESKKLIFLPTLGRSIIEGQAKWEDVIEFPDEFHYIEGYWEWTEDILSRCERILEAASIRDSVYASLFTYDCNLEVMKAFCEAWCPLTNTLLTSFGELSISLWDLHSLAGFPMVGSLYDEVIPSAIELTDINNVGNRSLYRTCSHILHAFHLLHKRISNRLSSGVSVKTWIQFWAKKTPKCSQPPPRKERRSVPRPTQKLHNPTSSFARHRVWNSAESACFSKLGVEESAMEETYLAAYLACWLSVFVLPRNDVNLIRPATFKMASVMASGQKVDLVIPVLTSKKSSICRRSLYDVR